jgi:hypothetical protein
LDQRAVGLSKRLSRFDKWHGLFSPSACEAKTKKPLMKSAARSFRSKTIDYDLPESVEMSASSRSVGRETHDAFPPGNWRMAGITRTP